MTNSFTVRTMLLTSLSAALIGFAVPALALPTEMQAGNITYITGGIGDDEREALEASKKNYNFAVMSANTQGELAGDTLLIIKDSAGNELLNTNAGPLLYANLPNGTYTVEASNEGQFKTQKITIRNGKQANIHLSWK